MEKGLKNADVLSVSLVLSWQGLLSGLCTSSLCKVYEKEVLTRVENDHIQEQIRELDVYKSMETAEGANYRL